MELGKQKQLSIQYLRGIAALFIVLCHISYIPFGQFGVDIFVCISGFVIMLSTESKGKFDKDFFFKKFIRIAPLYYFITLITFILCKIKPTLFYTTVANWPNLLKSILFIPYSCNGNVLPIFPIGWYINIAMELYLIFYIAMKISYKYRAVISLAILSILVIIGRVFKFAAEPYEFWTRTVLIEFIFGIVAFYIYKHFKTAKKSVKKSSFTVALFFVCLILFLIMILADSYNVSLDRSIKWGIPAFLMLLIFVMYFDMQKPSSYINKIFIYIGNISYSLYMTHYFVVKFFERLVYPLDRFNVYTFSLTILVIIIAVIVGSIFNLIFEKKLNGIIKKIYK